MCRFNVFGQQARQTTIWTCENFLGNYKALTFKDAIQNPLNTSIKLG